MNFLLLFLCAFIGVSSEKLPKELERTVSSAQLFETDSMESIIREIGPHTLVFIDIDDTLIDFDTHLGCKTWRTRIKESPLRNHHDTLTFYIAKQIKMGPVDPKMPKWVKELQARGHFLFPMTAREKDCWYDLDGILGNDEFTYRALLAAGMNFAETPLPHYARYLNQENFYRGIYFSKHPIDSEKMKGETIKEILSPLLVLPAHLRPEIEVFIIDDRKNQCESVLAELKSMGIPCRGYWYRGAEKNHAEFDFAVSLIQLRALLFDQRVLSNQEARDELAARGDLQEEELTQEILRRLPVVEALREKSCQSVW